VSRTPSPWREAAHRERSRKLILEGRGKWTPPAEAVRGVPHVLSPGPLEWNSSLSAAQRP